MGYFELTSDRDVSIDSIGYLKADESKRVSQEEAQLFEVFHKKRLADANFPNFVSLVYVLDEKKEV